MSGTKSCVDCPSYLKPDDAALYFRKGTGVPMCAQYGIALGIPDVPSEKIEQSYAESCGQYGKPKPPVPSTVGPYVFHGLATKPDWEDKPADNRVSSCAGCKFYVDSVSVAATIGYTAGACRAHGKLILDNRLAIEADFCDYKQMGTPSDSTDDLEWMDVYRQVWEEYTKTTPVFEIAEDGTPKMVALDPNDYVTDLSPIAPEDEAMGIRAWRKIINPEDPAKFTYLPIYRLDAFPEAEQRLIPKTGDDEHPEDYQDHAHLVWEVACDWTEFDDTPMLWGPPGTGKTELFRHIAWMMQMPFYRISVTGSTEVDDLIGKMEYGVIGTNDAGDPVMGTYPRYGRLVEAWQKPGVICLDEPNSAQDPAVWHALRPLTDNSKQMVLDQLRNEIIPRHPNCYMGMAANPAWDYRNSGVMQLADADGSRLSHHAIGLPPEEIERRILQVACAHDSYVIMRDTLNTIMKIAKDIRELAANQTIPITWGVRQQIRVARSTRMRSLLQSYRSAATDMLEPEAASLVLDIVKTYTPSVRR